MSVSTRAETLKNVRIIICMLFRRRKFLYYTTGKHVLRRNSNNDNVNTYHRYTLFNRLPRVYIYK